MTFSMLIDTITEVTELFGGKNKALKRSFKNEDERFKYLHRFNGELYPKQISRRMLTTSTLGVSISSLAAWYYGFYLLFIISVMVSIASFNFWRKPMRGFRRNVDMVVAVFSVWSHLVYVMFTDPLTFNTYLCLVWGAPIFYAFSKVAAKTGHLHIDSFFHCSMHLWGICWNIWTYRQMYLRTIPMTVP